MASKSSSRAPQHGHLSSRLLDMKFMKRNTNNRPNSDDELSADEKSLGSSSKDPSAWSFAKIVQKPHEAPLGFSDIEKPRVFGRRLWRNGKCAEVRTDGTENAEVNKEEAELEKKSSKPKGKKRRKDEDKSSIRPRKQKKA